MRGFSVFHVPTASSRPAKPSNLSSARRGPSPSLVASRADLLLRTRGHVPFYPINPINFSTPVSLYFFPMISPRLSPSALGPSSVFGEKKKRSLRGVWVPPDLAVPSAGSRAALQPFPFPPLPRGGGRKIHQDIFFFLAGSIKITWLRPKRRERVPGNLSLSHETPSQRGPSSPISLIFLPNEARKR